MWLTPIGPVRSRSASQERGVSARMRSEIRRRIASRAFARRTRAATQEASEGGRHQRDEAGLCARSAGLSPMVTISSSVVEERADGSGRSGDRDARQLALAQNVRSTEEGTSASNRPGDAFLGLRIHCLAYRRQTLPNRVTSELPVNRQERRIP